MWQQRLLNDMRTLGILDDIPLRLRLALRRRAHMKSSLAAHASSLLMYIFIAVAILWSSWIAWLVCLVFGLQNSQNPYLHPDKISYFPKMPDGPFSGDNEVDWSTFAPVDPPDWLMKGAALPTVLIVALGLRILVPLLARSARRHIPLVSWFFIARRYSLVMQCADAVHAAAEAVRSGGEARTGALRQVSVRLRTVRRNLADAPSSRRSVPRFSQRKRALRRHARHVGVALQEIELKIDAAPDEALRELGQALIMISDRYCQARLASLLDESHLEAIDEPSNRELLRWVISLLVAGLSVAALGISGVLPESVEGIIYPIAVLLALTITFGRKIHRSIEALGAIIGGV